MTKRILTCIAVAASVAGAAPAAASAAITAGGSFVRTIPFIDGNIYVFECHAAAPGAASVTISRCQVTDGFDSFGAQPVTSSGPLAVADGAVSAEPDRQWRICWTASAGGATSSGCSATASPLAGAGESL